MAKKQGEKISEEAKRSEEQEQEDTPVIRSVRELAPVIEEVAEQEETGELTSSREVSLEERTESASSEVFEEEAGTAGRVVSPVLPATGAVQALPVRRLVAGSDNEGEERAAGYAVTTGADITGGGRSSAEFSVYESVRRQEERAQQKSYTVEQTPRAVAPVLNPVMSAPDTMSERAARTPLFRNPDLGQFEGQRSKYEYRRPEPEREGEQKRKLPWQ